MRNQEQKLLLEGWTVLGFNAFREEFSRFIELTDLLSNDTNVLFPTTTDETSMRAYIRAVFASIEGTTFALKQLALRQAEHGRGGFTSAELAMLREETFDLNEKGAAYAQQKFLKLPSNLTFAFDVCSRPFGFRYEIDRSNQEWNKFQEAIKVRNRLTHPKTVEDLRVSAADILCVAETANWFIVQQKELLTRIDSYVTELHKKIH